MSVFWDERCEVGSRTQPFKSNRQCQVAREKPAFEFDPFIFWPILSYPQKVCLRPTSKQIAICLSCVIHNLKRYILEGLVERHWGLIIITRGIIADNNCFFLKLSLESLNNRGNFALSGTRLSMSKHVRFLLWTTFNIGAKSLNFDLVWKLPAWCLSLDETCLILFLRRKEGGFIFLSAVYLRGDPDRRF